MLNKHGLKMVGLKKAVGEMPGENYRGAYLQVNYDTVTGEIYTNYHVSFGHNSWSVYHDKTIICIGNFEKATMQELADRIAYRMEEYRLTEYEMNC